MVATDALRAIFRTNLGVKKTEHVLVFTDRPSKKEELGQEERQRRESLRDITLLTVETGRSFCKKMLYCEFPSTGNHGAEPPARLWEAAFGRTTVEALKGKGLLNPILKKRVGSGAMLEAEKIIKRNARHAVDAVVALSYYSTSHTAFRGFLTRLCEARYASMPLFEPRMLEGPMNADWKAVAKLTRSVCKALGMYDTVRVTTPDGTDVTFCTKGRRAHADTGILTRRGAFGNLPAGEAYLAPLEGTASGTLVLQWAATRELASPVTLRIKDGLVTGVTGTEPYCLELEKKLSERPENRNIAELGIGTNEFATRPDNILESEKILGSVHIALGDNHSFGGKVKTPFHQDYVFFHPTVTLTGKDGRVTLLKDGKLNQQLLDRA